MPKTSIAIRVDPSALAKSAVLVSACLCGRPCRYHGRLAPTRRRLIERLSRQYRIIEVCPEQLGGLSTPRPPTYWRDGKMISAGRDVTAEFERGALRTLDLARECGAAKFYGVRGSPSCDPRSGMTAVLLSLSGIPCHFG